MKIYEEFILNIILVVFPILVYFIYCCYTSLRSDKNNSYILGFFLFTSLYLSLKYGSNLAADRILLFSNIPIVIAYLKKNSCVAILLSLFTIFYSSLVFDYSFIVISGKLLCYLITYLIYQKYNFKENTFLSVIAVIQGFFLSFEYFFRNHTNGINAIFSLFGIVILFYIVTFFILYLFKLIDKITNLHSEVRELEKEKKIKDSLFKLTHEIKNPIAVCNGYLDMIDVNDSKKVAKYIPIIKQEIARSLNIMTDFMEYSKININKEIIDINLLLDDVYDSFKIINKMSNIKLEYKESEDEIYIDGDYNRLKQVILNLIKNSSEAIVKNGIIKISSEVKDNKYMIYIEDNGSGMDSETLKHIKDLFYTTKEKGSGIGVSLSNEIIKAHNGKLKYSSKLNEGTKVTIILPILENIF